MRVLIIVPVYHTKYTLLIPAPGSKYGLGRGQVRLNLGVTSCEVPVRFPSGSGEVPVRK